MRKAEDIKKIVKEKYKEIAQDNCGCGCGCKSGQNIAKDIGYSDEEIKIGEGANLGLGCGNPVAMSKIKEGDTVLDLGCGAGFDCFLASKKVGEAGKVIGLDMTEEMIEKSKINAKNSNIKNVEFILGEIEKLPIKDNSIDVVISNCVINLAPDKERVFRETYRVLKTGGRLMVSDVVLTKPLPDELKNDEELLSGCVAGAILKQDYLNLLKKAGFDKITIHKETPGFLKGYTVSITFSAFKL